MKKWITTPWGHTSKSSPRLNLNIATFIKIWLKPCMPAGNSQVILWPNILAVAVNSDHCITQTSVLLIYTDMFSHAAQSHGTYIHKARITHSYSAYEHTQHDMSSHISSLRVRQRRTLIRDSKENTEEAWEFISAKLKAKTGGQGTCQVAHLFILL